MISQLLRKKYPRNLFFLKTNQTIDKKLNKTIKNSKIILPKNKIDSMPWKHTQSYRHLRNAGVLEYIILVASGLQQ